MKKNKIFKTLSLCTTLAFLFTFFLKLDILNADCFHSIKVNQKIEIEDSFIKPKDNFNYVIKAITKDAPLPNGESYVFNFSLKGDEEKTFDINFTKEGDFVYKVYQEKNENLKNVKIDEKVYTIKVQVVKVQQGVKRKLYTIMDDTGHKCEDIIFINKYNKKPSNDKTPPGNEEEKPTNSKIKRGKIFDKFPNTAIYKPVMMSFITMIFFFIILFVIKRKKEQEQLD